MFSRDVSNTYSIIFGLTRPELEPTMRMRFRHDIIEMLLALVINVN